MNVAVVGSLTLHERQAWALNTVKMAQGFVRATTEGDVYLLCRQSNKTDMDEARFREAFGLTDTRLKIVAGPHWLGARWLFGGWAVLQCVRLGVNRVYARHFAASILGSFLGTLRPIHIVMESHAHPGNVSRDFRLAGWVAARCKAFSLWVTISPVLKNHYCERFGIKNEKVLILADAVDERLFERPSVLLESRYAGKGPHIVYAGHLYDYKGIPTVLEAAAMLPRYQFHFVGGLAEDIDRHKQVCRQRGLENVHFTGFVNHADIPPYLWHADALLLPPSGHHPSAQWTSPMKLGEYMFSEKPVICSDISALKTWVDETQVSFFKADDAGDLAEVISRVLENKETYLRKAKTAALDFAKSITYVTRASRILKQLNA